MNDSTKKLTEDEFREKLLTMFKAGSIKWSDIPKKHREYVAIKVFGRYPLKNFGDLLVMNK